MHLQARGYTTEETQKRIHEIQLESLQEHLEDAQTTKQNRPCTTYSPWWTGLRKALTNQWKFIDTDPTLKKLFPEQPMIAYRRTRNIREYVSSAKLPKDATTCPSEIQPYSQQIDFPISRYNHQQCGTYIMLRRRKEIKSTVTKEKFQITDRMTCATIMQGNLRNRM